MLDSASKKKLIRLINPKAFRFIVILYDTTNDISAVKSYIDEHFPLYKSKVLDIKYYDYESFSPELYDKENTFIYVESFIDFLKKKELYEPFNQRRDKLAKYPINFIFFAPKALQEKIYEDALLHIADLWEFRSGIVELASDRNNKRLLEDIKLKSFSSLGGLTRQSKEIELERLKEYIKEEQLETELMGNILGQIGRLEYDLGRYDKALKYLEKSLAIREEIGDRAGEGATLNNISSIYHAQGDYDKALKYLEKSLAIREEIGDRAGEGATLNNISSIYHAQGDYDKALKYLEKSLAIQEEIGDRAGEGATLNNISQVYDAQGDYDKALKYLEKSLAIQEEIGDRAGEGATLFNLGHIALQENKKEKAQMYWKKAEQIAKQIGNAKVLQALKDLKDKRIYMN